MTVDLGEKFALGTNADSLNARLVQVVLSFTTVPGVKYVRLLVKGGVPLGLFPGFPTSRPLTRQGRAAPDGRAAGHDAAGLDRPDHRGDARRCSSASPTSASSTRPRSTARRASRRSRRARVPEVAGPRPRRRRRARDAEGARDGRAADTADAGGTGTRVEVLLDRQLALFIRDGQVVRTLPVSSGAPGFETPPGYVHGVPQGRPLLVGAVQGVAALGELLRRRDRLPRVARRAAPAGLARLRSHDDLRRAVALPPDPERHAGDRAGDAHERARRPAARGRDRPARCPPSAGSAPPPTQTPGRARRRRQPRRAGLPGRSGRRARRSSSRAGSRSTSTRALAKRLGIAQVQFVHEPVFSRLYARRRRRRGTSRSRRSRSPPHGRRTSTSRRRTWRPTRACSWRRTRPSRSRWQISRRSSSARSAGRRRRPRSRRRSGRRKPRSSSTSRRACSTRSSSAAAKP